MNRNQLFDLIRKKQSFLCVGLDTDIDKIPRHFRRLKDPVFEFNKQIIDATHHLAIAYKPNLAFYEAQGSKGLEALEKTMAYMPNDVLSIADAKRGDIGNTSSMYAKAYFDQMQFGAVTVTPYMGSDSVTPYYEYEGKYAVILASTSNPGALDFQDSLLVENNEKVFERVLRVSSQWGHADNTMYVVGATRPEVLQDVRKIVPDHFLLIPGVGAQGGSLSDVCKYGMNNQCGIIVNSSRGIIYAGKDEDFASAAAVAASKLQEEMERELQRYF